MQIKEFHIENFKAFGGQVKIPLKPITLIFGPNSSGKSSIFQSLLVLKQSALEMHKDGLSFKGGEGDFGSYKNLVHNHDDNLNMKFAFSFSTDEVGAIGKVFSKLDIPHSDVQKIYRVIESFKKFTFSLTFDKEGMLFFDVLFDDIKHPAMTVPVSKEYKIPVEENDLINIPTDKDVDHEEVLKEIESELERLLDKDVEESVSDCCELKEYRFSGRPRNAISLAHPFWRCYWEEFDKPTNNNWVLTTFKKWFFQGDYWDYYEEDWHAIIHILKEERGFNQAVNLYNLMNRSSSVEKWKGPIAEELSRGSLPDYSKRIEAETNNWGLYSPVGDPLLVALLMSQLLKWHLSWVTYLGPLRELPARVYTSERSSQEGMAGLDAVYALRESEGIVNKVNHELSSLGFNYQLKINEFLNEDTGAIDVFSINLKKTDSEVWSTLNDVGFGFSQVLPIIVECVRGGSKNISGLRKYATFKKLVEDGENDFTLVNNILVEQPELHLHPEKQAELGDLFIRTVLQESREKEVTDKPLGGFWNLDRSFFVNSSVIVETHSEHLILRILRRIRETTNKDLPPNVPPISPDDVAILYVQPGENGSEVIEIPVTADGEFARPWPQGFFAERAKELF